jgi:hypothetical protein
MTFPPDAPDVARQFSADPGGLIDIFRRAARCDAPIQFAEDNAMMLARLRGRRRSDRAVADHCSTQRARHGADTHSRDARPAASAANRRDQRQPNLGGHRCSGVPGRGPVARLCEELPALGRNEPSARRTGRRRSILSSATTRPTPRPFWDSSFRASTS